MNKKIIILLFANISMYTSSSSFLCSPDLRSNNSYDDSVRSQNYDQETQSFDDCYQNLYDFTYADNTFYRPDISYIESPFKSISIGITSFNANYVIDNTPLNDSLRNDSSRNYELRNVIRQESYTDAIFWTETLTRFLSKGDKAYSEDLVSKKVLLRLIFLVSQNGILFSEYDNHALIRSRNLKEDDSFKHQALEFNFPTATIFSKNNRAAFSFITPLGESGFDAITTFNDEYFDKEGRIQQFGADNDQYCDKLFGIHNFNNSIFCVEYKRQSVKNPKDALKSLSKMVKNKLSDKNKSAVQINSINKKISFFGHFGGVDNMTNGERIESSYEDVYTKYTSMDLHSNIINTNEHPNGLIQGKSTATQAKETMTVSFKTYYQQYVENDNNISLTSSHSWSYYRENLKYPSIKIPAELGSIAIPVLNDRKSLYNLFSVSDSIIDKIETDKTSKERFKIAIFKILAAETNSYRKSAVESLSSVFQTQYTESPVQTQSPVTFDNLQDLQTIRYLKSITNDNEEVNSSSISQNSICKFGEENYLNKNCTKLIEDIFHLQHKIIKVLVKKSKKNSLDKNKADKLSLPTASEYFKKLGDSTKKLMKNVQQQIVESPKPEHPVASEVISGEENDFFKRYEQNYKELFGQTDEISNKNYNKPKEVADNHPAYTNNYYSGYENYQYQNNKNLQYDNTYNQYDNSHHNYDQNQVQDEKLVSETYTCSPKYQLMQDKGEIITIDEEKGDDTLNIILPKVPKTKTEEKLTNMAKSIIKRFKDIVNYVKNDPNAIYDEKYFKLLIKYAQIAALDFINSENYDNKASTFTYLIEHAPSKGLSDFKKPITGFFNSVLKIKKGLNYHIQNLLQYLDTCVQGQSNQPNYANSRIYI